MTLNERLQSIKTKSAAAMTPEVLAAMKQGFDELNRAKILEKALKVGDTAPAFTLPNSTGKIIDSGSLLRQGPLVILFYRGKW
jgi:hypothetical protein